MPINTPIGRQGWRQGSLLSKEDHIKLDAHVRADLRENARVVIASHDCDVTSDSYDKEPKVDLIVIYPTQKKGGRTFGKNPRELELVLVLTGGEAAYLARGCDRPQNDRKFLETITPDSTSRLPSQAVDQLRSWLAQRPNRGVFPDEFGRRTAKIKDKLEAIFDKMGSDISTILIAIKPDGEANDNQSYDAVLYAVMPVELFEQSTARVRAQKLVEEVEKLFRDCVGITLNGAEVRSEADVSMNDLRYLKRFTGDYLSFKNVSSVFPP